ncbi:MAG TPA: M28 family peptidase [Paludibacteraceae bacterium]|nr:M28 family peptidase [Paludibacteraceae bacterium]HOH55503.1 M28 family peptidase [Paludibacteraceae bacterium]
MKNFLAFIVMAFFLVSCHPATRKTTNEEKVINIPSFDADSAFSFVQHQVDFGARVPNTPAHDACANFFVSTLKGFGAQVTTQEADLRAFDGTVIHAVNIIASFHPELETRILLFAHWDTRPWADNDPKPENRKKPVLGANDGASGTGVLLEIARQLGKHSASVGVDIIFFDAEDWGTNNAQTADSDNSWCLGTQYWAKHPHKDGYHARYGILLDMVGAPQATFYREQFSEYYAAHIVDKVWSQAQNLGFGQFFINQKGGGITDDHVFVNQMAGIPSIDIIHFDPNTNTGFGSYWHTVHDDMSNIDRNTLFAVGTTLMNVIYNEK